MHKCGLTECKGKPRCGTCRVMWPARARSKEVHVVIGRDYGGNGRGHVVRVFEDAADADEHRLQCDAHQRRRPEAPAHIEDTPENDAEHEAWAARFKRWQQRHPGGKLGWTCDEFLCEPHKVWEATTPRVGPGRNALKA